MIVDPALANYYPDLCFYLSVGMIGEVLQSKHIFDGLRLYGQLETEDATKALMPSFPPRIHVVDIKPDSTLAGTNHVTAPNDIFLDYLLGEKFTQLQRYWTTRDRVAVLSIGITVLHELVHWGDFIYNGILDDGPGMRFARTTDFWCRGKDFEEYVFGADCPFEVDAFVKAVLRGS
jgi:hypothetical protein